MEKVMQEFEKWQKQLQSLEAGTCQYCWDELEELITDSYSDEKLSDKDFETLMHQLMQMDCEL